jgi:hypothetical protein
VYLAKGPGQEFLAAILLRQQLIVRLPALAVVEA